jgi:hypothetical protein
MKSFIASGLYGIAWGALSSRLGVPVSDPAWWIVLLAGGVIILVLAHDK